MLTLELIAVHTIADNFELVRRRLAAEIRSKTIGSNWRIYCNILLVVHLSTSECYQNPKVLEGLYSV
jgi:hypothetical protein